MSENREPESRGSKRRLPISDVSCIIRQGGDRFADVRNGAISKLTYSERHTTVERREGSGERSVQILNNALEGCKLKISTVPNQGEEEIRGCGDFADEYGRGLKQIERYEFCRQVWEFIIIWLGKSNTLADS